MFQVPEGSDKEANGTDQEAAKSGNYFSSNMFHFVTGKVNFKFCFLKI